jgi:glycolate oxidase iron-sulfur subunit
MSEGGVFTPELLDRCISCGFCLPACPTYTRTGVETSSPRGRINLMRALETGELGLDDPTIREESSFCLGCRACEPVCPAGVQYGELLEEWRGAVWQGRRRPWKLRPLTWGVDARWRVRAMGLVARHARRRRAGGGNVQLMLGCVERMLFPAVSRAASALVPEAEVTPAQGCCGALHAHNGELERGRELAQQLGRDLPGTILTTSGGCAAHIAHVLGADRVRELSQWLDDSANRPPAPSLREGAAVEPGPGADPVPGRAGPAVEGETAPPARSANGNAGRRLRIALQDSCHLRNGLGVFRQPRALIATVGEYVELPSASECCGAAGTYAILRPKDSQRVLDDKLDEIAAAGVDVVVAVNPGCLRQLRQGLKGRGSTVRAVHIAELLMEAEGR